MTEDMFYHGFCLIDFRVMDDCLKETTGVYYVFNFAAGMGGMEFILCNHSMYSNATTSFSVLEASRIHENHFLLVIWRTFNHDQRSQSVWLCAFICILLGFPILKVDLYCYDFNTHNWTSGWDQNIEGKGGIAPTVEELAGALKSHDLFTCIGHGSGAQYIPRHEVQKLENRAAALLMGCSSGSSLPPNGKYTPQGTHLSYLSAGFLVIVANLWECRLVAELESLSITGAKGNAKKKIPMKSKVNVTSLGTVNVDFRP
ncbi:hypothetical protein VitviT2T_028249 [Vitis vinifera]|uniref:separase n=2 Tax=Vitis vinifera TaxID=29760 RepID=A0ABY9DUF3_VITVI|nr:Separase [Vitis vinifera]WKA10689.1 hypothetical protein VitviT2T_028249 [Vitis vinifera]